MIIMQITKILGMRRSAAHGNISVGVLSCGHAYTWSIKGEDCLPTISMVQHGATWCSLFRTCSRKKHHPSLWSSLFTRQVINHFIIFHHYQLHSWSGKHLPPPLIIQGSSPTCDHQSARAWKCTPAQPVGFATCMTWTAQFALNSDASSCSLRDPVGSGGHMDGSMNFSN